MSVVAFRRWRVGANGELRALRPSSEYTWPLAGPALASCDCAFGTAALVHWAVTANWESEPEREPHPALRSTCGLYGYKRPVPQCCCDDPQHPRHGAVGVVRLWGRAVEHTEGWRALYGECVAVVDYTGRLNPAYAAARYQDLATMYGEWAPDLPVHDHEDRNWCGHKPLSPMYPYVFGSSEPTIITGNSGIQVRLDVGAFTKSAREAQAVIEALNANVTARSLDFGARIDALEARKRRDTGPKRNPFRRRGKDHR